MLSPMPAGQYFGRVDRARKIRAAHWIETLYPAGAQLPRHLHERPYLCVVLGGGFFEHVRQRAHECCRGTLIYNTAAEPHCDGFGTAGGRCLNIELDDHWLALTPHGRRDECAEILCAGPARSAVERLAFEWRRPDGPCPLEMECLVLELLTAVRRDRIRHQAHSATFCVRDALTVLHERFDAPPALRELADLLGVHPAHLARAFQKQLHCTLGQFVRNLRIQSAFQALWAGREPLADIALRCGFADQSHFTRAIRSAYGQTPAAIRRARDD